MTIRTIPIKGGTRYFIEDHYQRATICYFDDLETAGLVLRYLKGSVMRSGDQERALQAMRDYDTRKGAKDADPE